MRSKGAEDIAFQNKARAILVLEEFKDSCLIKKCSKIPFYFLYPAALPKQNVYVAPLLMFITFFSSDHQEYESDVNAF